MKDCYGCFGASFNDCERCPHDKTKLIKLEDAIEAVINTPEIKEHAYRSIIEKLHELEIYEA